MKERNQKWYSILYYNTLAIYTNKRKQRNIKHKQKRSSTGYKQHNILTSRVPGLHTNAWVFAKRCGLPWSEGQRVSGEKINKCGWRRWESIKSNKPTHGAGSFLSQKMFFGAENMKQQLCILPKVVFSWPKARFSCLGTWYNLGRWELGRSFVVLCPPERPFGSLRVQVPPEKGFNP